MIFQLFGDGENLSILLFETKFLFAAYWENYSDLELCQESLNEVEILKTM